MQCKIKHESERAGTRERRNIKEGERERTKLTLKNVLINPKYILIRPLEACPVTTLSPPNDLITKDETTTALSPYLFSRHEGWGWGRLEREREREVE